LITGCPRFPLAYHALIRYAIVYVIRLRNLLVIEALTPTTVTVFIELMLKKGGFAGLARKAESAYQASGRMDGLGF